MVGLGQIWDKGGRLLWVGASQLVGWEEYSVLFPSLGLAASPG